jgi:pimeloyl-ACP methyl ester carboxylesterase
LRLINGAADPNSGAHMVRAFRQHRPDADVVSLEGIGHWPQIQAPEQVAQAMLAFLAQHEPGLHPPMHTAP